jgi:serine phosphatase RsbU (regulator of sigma subunit)
MTTIIKLKRVCQKGKSAELIKQFCSHFIHVPCIVEQNNEVVFGTFFEGTRHPILLNSETILGWVIGDTEDAVFLADLISYIVQKELESKLLAQETLSKYKELTLLYELGEKISNCIDIEQLAQLTLNEAQSLLSTKKSLQIAILLKDQTDDQLLIFAGRGAIFPAGSKLSSIDGITKQVLISGNSEIVNNVPGDPRYLSDPGVFSGIKALLCTPIKTRDHSFGVLSIVSVDVFTFNAAEAKVLNLLASQVAIAIGRIQLINERVSQERYQESLILSKNIQKDMLPTDFPRFTDGNRFDLYAFMQPAREVGGDFYDFFRLNHTTLLVVIGDVSGKGVPAALFMVKVITLVRVLAKQYLLPNDILHALNIELCRDNDAMMFVTLFIATLDLESNSLTFSYGGHNRPLLLSRYGIVSKLPGESGMALGILDTSSFCLESIQLNMGDSLILYTDGINEAMSINYEEYGDERFIQLLKGLDQFNAQELIETITSDVLSFTIGAEQSDDITLLTLKISTD